MNKKIMSITALILSTFMLITGCGKTSADTDWSKYVTLGEYKGVTADQEAIVVTDEDVEAQLKTVLSQNQISEEITDRPIENGDTANIDYEGKLDGVAFDGGTAKAYDLVIGSGSFIPGFEEGLVGKKTGETVDLDITFPAEYQSAELAGKAVVFTVKINSVSLKTMPTMSDEFVQSISDAKTVDEYKEIARKDVGEQKKQTQEANEIGLIWKKIVDGCTIIEYPKDEIKFIVDDMTKYYKESAKEQDQKFADFLQANLQTDEKGFKEMAEEQAKAQVGENVIARAIAQKEGITLTDEEYKTAVEQYSKQYGAESVEDFEKQYTKEKIEDLILWDKVLEFIKTAK